MSETSPVRLPTFREIALRRIVDAGRRDKTINVKVAINTARMMVESESFAANRYQDLLAFANRMFSRTKCVCGENAELKNEAPMIASRLHCNHCEAKACITQAQGR